MKVIWFEDEQEDAVHTRGEVGCEGCCCGVEKCRLCDSGLIHCEFIGDESEASRDVHARRCDKCEFEWLNEEGNL